MKTNSRRRKKYLVGSKDELTTIIHFSILADAQELKNTPEREEKIVFFFLLTDMAFYGTVAVSIFDKPPCVCGTQGRIKAEMRIRV